jgi:hypothetical protein
MCRIVTLGALGLAVGLGIGCGGGGSEGASPIVGSSNADDCFVASSGLVSAGPGRDGIPALTNPVVVSVSEAGAFLAPEALVLGVVENGEARAYPHSVLWWHEIVNDELGGMPIVVSYCPLTGSGLVHDRRGGGQTLDFGVSGLLFQNNLVMFDRATESLWSQMRVQSVCGSLKGTVPTLRPVVQSTWAAWRTWHPDTSVVSTDTGFDRNYGVYPYGGYDHVGNDSILFPQTYIDQRRPLKELSLGIVEGSAEKAYPYGLMGERSALNDVVGGRPIVVVFDARAEMALAFDRRTGSETLTFEVAETGGFPFQLRDVETGSRWSLDGLAIAGPLAGSTIQQVATFSAMWFAWAAFHPQTELLAPWAHASPVGRGPKADAP